MLTAQLCVHWKHIRFTFYSNTFYSKDTYYWSTALKWAALLLVVKTGLLLHSSQTENSTCIWPCAKNIVQIYLFNCLLMRCTALKGKLAPLPFKQVDSHAVLNPGYCFVVLFWNSVLKLCCSYFQVFLSAMWKLSKSCWSEDKCFNWLIGLLKTFSTFFLHSIRRKRPHFFDR